MGRKEGGERVVGCVGDLGDCVERGTVVVEGWGSGTPLGEGIFKINA